jgi:hypothetical protein
MAASYQRGQKFKSRLRDQPSSVLLFSSGKFKDKISLYHTTVTFHIPSYSLIRSRFHRPRGLRRGCTAVRYWEWGFECYRGHGSLSVVSVVCCQVEVSATGWSLVQRNPTECGVSECNREASIKRHWSNGRGGGVVFLVFLLNMTCLFLYLLTP